MNNKKWKRFDQLTLKCFNTMIGMEKDQECWNHAYELFKELVDDMKHEQPNGKLELYKVDDITDFEYEVQDWVDDYLDKLDMNHEYEQLLEVCDALLEMFCWEDDSPSDIRFRKVSVLGALKRNDEAATFCRQWLDDEPDNILAVTASVYAGLARHDMKTAEILIKQHISRDTECTEENAILFTAASTYYQVAGKKKEKKRIDEAIKAYEKILKDFWLGGDDEDESMWEDDELPF
ncbi:MAG: hypothetical protein K2G55_19685 [Lachnospiraceae bacterium]|nr:hypothetical protein [Lachnospiraceae bacterium]MDE7201194.1 hypothetical protein [Lachnospiraceae bacterium]